ncbi:MAG TPA: hypothetical protein VGB95_07365, partial [Chitinophagales bacterium]
PTTISDSTKIKLTQHHFQEIPKAIFGNETNFYVLLRPDNYISYIGKDIEQCREFINNISTEWTNSPQ